jgi:signal transduction histidine kinase/PAS domain-containing protein
MNETLYALLQNDERGQLLFGGARMALFDIGSAFWGLRRQLEALAGPRLADAVLQQAGANGGASFARNFAPDVTEETAASAFRDCLAAYETAGFGRFEIETLRWPISRICVRGHNTFEAWMLQKHGQKPDRPGCAYTAGVLVGFINALTGRQDIVCVKKSCQAQGADHCTFELLPAAEAATTAVVAFDPDPFLSQQVNLLDILFAQMPMGVVILDHDLRIRRFNPTLVDFVSRYSKVPLDDVVPGTSYLALLPGNEEAALTIFDRALAGETVQTKAFGLEIDGIPSYWDSVTAPLRENGQLIGLVHVTTDVTERVLAEQRLHETLATMLRMAQNLVSTVEIKPLLGMILEQLQSVIDYDGAAVFVQKEDYLQLVAYRGPIEQDTALALRFPLTEVGVNRMVVESRAPVVIGDVHTDETVAAAAFRQAADDHGSDLFSYIRSWLGVPLLVKDRVLGMLCLDQARPHFYTPFHSELALAFASQIAVAIENARLREQTEQMAAVAERNRLARELHDAVTQTLFSASLIADVLPRLWQRSPEVGQAKLEELRELTRGALAEMRTLLLELRPATLTESSLEELLRQLATAVIGRSRLQVAVEVEGEEKRPLSPETQVALYRMAQEALNNVVKHAGASQVTISLRFDEAITQLRVADNGRGFDPAAVSVHSLGLGIMRDRATKIGAALHIESKIGEGTAVCVRVEEI